MLKYKCQTRGAGKTIVDTMKIIDKWAKECEYEYVYKLETTGIIVYFYNSPFYKEFKCNVSFVDPLNQIQKAFERRLK